MTTKNRPVESTAAREIIISREVNAPRELVWEAMTNPQHVVNWWGPRGFSVTIEEMDFRVGGVWKQVMHGPDGTNYPNEHVFQEIVKPERIVFSHGGRREGGKGIRFVATWTFDAVGAGKTKVTIHQIYPTAAERDFVEKEFHAIEGGRQTLERLSEHLVVMAAAGVPEVSDRDFVISRVLNAPRELVWQAWTQPNHMMQWWGPRMITNVSCEMDVRAGGALRMVMRGPEGNDYPIRGVFREVTPPARLVFTMDPTEHPASWHDLVDPNRKDDPNPAGEMVATITLENLDGKTKLNVQVRLKSAAVRDNMVKMGMNEGWSGSLDRLEELLARIS